jgi:hypothetical protein
MQFKSIPEPPPASVDAIEAVATARDALPIVPRSEDDCCGRLVERVKWIDARDAATTWIGFLRALELAERNASGYTRVRGEIDPDAVRERFRAGILGARETIDALGAEPRSPDVVFEATKDVVPEWERRRSDTWRAEWIERTGRLLAWAASLGIAERSEAGFVRNSAD